VVFQPSGSISSAEVLDPPFAGTPTGGCIVRAFMSMRIPPFASEHSPVTVIKSVSIQ
jgi:hypothetical protein